MTKHSSDWDSNIPKHFVRLRGWLPACLEIKNLLEPNQIKYFTLCAKQAIDIFMLEKEKVLQRDAGNKLPDVIICERKEPDAAEILSLVRPPLKNAIIIGNLHKIMGKKDQKFLDEEYIRSKEGRQNKRNIELYERLVAEFPFDIINLDPFGTFLHPEPDQNEFCTVLDNILEKQSEHGKEVFLLLLTTPLYNEHPDTLEYFESAYKNNIESESSIQEAAMNEYHSEEFTAIENHSNMLAIGLLKSVVLQKANAYNYNCDIKKIIHYESEDNKPFMSSVILLSSNNSDTIQEEYINQVIQLITKEPTVYFEQSEELDKEVKNHLDEIIEYREKVRNEYLNE